MKLPDLDRPAPVRSVLMVFAFVLMTGDFPNVVQGAAVGFVIYHVIADIVRVVGALSAWFLKRWNHGR